MVETGTRGALSARDAVDSPTFPVFPLYITTNFTAHIVTMFCSDPTFCIRVHNIACWFLHVKQYCLLKIGFFLIELPDNMLNVNTILSYLFDIVVVLQNRGIRFFSLTLSKWRFRQAIPLQVVFFLYTVITRFGF